MEPTPEQTIAEIAAMIRSLPELDRLRYWKSLAALAQEQEEFIRDEIASFG